MGKRTFHFLIVGLLALCLACAAMAQSKGPSPGLGKAESQQPQAHSQAANQPSASDQRGTDQVPFVVKTIPAPKTEAETAEEKAERADVSSANWWMVRLTAVIGFIGIIQCIVFAIQASRLRQTIDAMRDIANDQSTDMDATIAAGTRSAAAMESVAQSIATQVETTRTMAQTQRQFWQRQMRAYIGIVPGAVFEQDTAPHSHFECQPLIQNDGLTPAYDVIYTSRTTLLPHPLPDNFDFTLPPPLRPSRSTLNPRSNIFMVNVADAYYSPVEYEELKRPSGRRLYTYGEVAYTDVNGDSHITKFCFFFAWGNLGKPTHFRTDRNNDSD